MQYFQNFSALYYNVNGKQELVIDILKRALMKTNVINNVEAYLLYTVKDGDSLQSISYDLYGTVYPFWVIMLINQELNPYYCLPISEDILKKQSIIKYGEEHLYDLHHYENQYGDVVENPVFFDEISKKYYMLINNEKVYINENIDVSIIGEKYVKINNWQYEVNENEKKRHIKLLRPEYLDFVINEFDALVGGNS